MCESLGFLIQEQMLLPAQRSKFMNAVVLFQVKGEGGGAMLIFILLNFCTILSFPMLLFFSPWSIKFPEVSLWSDSSFTFPFCSIPHWGPFLLLGCGAFSHLNGISLLRIFFFCSTRVCCFPGLLFKDFLRWPYSLLLRVDLQVCCVWWNGLSHPLLNFYFT